MFIGRGIAFITIFLAAWSFSVTAMPLRPRTTFSQAAIIESEPAVSPWSSTFNYAVATDLADDLQPRLYFQSVTAGLNYQVHSQWAINMGLNASFTTVDGQIDKQQEDTRLESAGVSPTVALMYSPNFSSPWFFSVSGQALGDTASRRMGYLGLMSASAGGTFQFFDQRYAMTHSVAVSEIINEYDTMPSGAANPGTSVSYNFGNAIRITSWLSLNASFGFKQTRYLDGFWDYAYSTNIGLAANGENWSVAVSTSNGGFTDEGYVDLWYVDEYRRIVTLSAGMRF